MKAQVWRVLLWGGVLFLFREPILGFIGGWIAVLGLLLTIYLVMIPVMAIFALPSALVSLLWRDRNPTLYN